MFTIIMKFIKLTFITQFYNSLKIKIIKLLMLLINSKMLLILYNKQINQFNRFKQMYKPHTMLTNNLLIVNLLKISAKTQKIGVHL